MKRKCPNQIETHGNKKRQQSKLENNTRAKHLRNAQQRPT